MSGRLLFAVWILSVFLVTSPLAAVEIPGTVASVDGDTITITAKSEFVPNEGDAVEVFVDVPGVGKALVASAKVTSVSGDGIVAKVVESTGRVAAGQQVTIDSPKATRRPDAQVPPLIGMTAQDAKTAVVEAGFVGKFQLGVAAPLGLRPFTVYAQDPPPEGKLARGQTVTLTLYARSGDSPATEPAWPRDRPAVRTDLDLIQGTWECVAAFEDGKPVESFAGVLATFQGNRLTWKRMPMEGSQTIEATYTLDPTKSPKHLDWVPNGSNDAHKRIYSLDEDTLRMSTNFGSNPRPASFEAGKWQFVMKRVKPTE